MAKIAIKVTSAFLYGGKIRKPDEEFEVTRKEAVNLEQRGKVELIGGGEEDLASMNVQELRRVAEDYGIEGANKMKKDELITAIEAADDADGE